jgi:hypothetical protein
MLDDDHCVLVDRAFSHSEIDNCSLEMWDAIEIIIMLIIISMKIMILNRSPYSTISEKIFAEIEIF